MYSSIVLVGYWASLRKPGECLFQKITPSTALFGLRSMLSTLGVQQPFSYRTHDLRRGYTLVMSNRLLFINLIMCRHARDLQAKGTPLHMILAAGEWRSPAFLDYLDVNELEADAVVEAHMNDSSGDEMDH